VRPAHELVPNETYADLGHLWFLSVTEPEVGSRESEVECSTMASVCANASDEASDDVADLVGIAEKAFDRVVIGHAKTSRNFEMGLDFKERPMRD
jgi:hypothetical protein